MRKEKKWKPIIQTLICDCGKVHKKELKCLCPDCNKGKLWHKKHPNYTRDYMRKYALIKPLSAIGNSR